MRKVIFLVEDHKELSSAVRLRLESADFEVIPCYKGAALLEKIKYTIPDLVILDIDLPDINGLDLLGQIRKTPRMEKVKFLILTGLTEKLEDSGKTDSELKAKLQVSAYISKPFDSNVLLEEVKKLIDPLK